MKNRLCYVPLSKDIIYVNDVHIQNELKQEYYGYARGVMVVVSGCCFAYEGIILTSSFSAQIRRVLWWAVANIYS